MLVHGTLPRPYLDSLDKEAIKGKTILRNRIDIFENFYLNSQFGVEDPVILDSDRQFLAIIGTPFYKNKHLTDNPPTRTRRSSEPCSLKTRVLNNWNLFAKCSVV